MDQFARIRQLRPDALTIRQIAEQLHHSPKTILKAFANAEPVPLRSSTPRPAPVFGPFREFVDEILAADETAPRKQRHTARQIHRRLLAEKGYAGQYDQVRRYLRWLRLDRRETFRRTSTRPCGSTGTATARSGHTVRDDADTCILLGACFGLLRQEPCEFGEAFLTGRFLGHQQPKVAAE